MCLPCTRYKENHRRLFIHFVFMHFCYIFDFFCTCNRSLMATVLNIDNDKLMMINLFTESEDH